MPTAEADGHHFRRSFKVRWQDWGAHGKATGGVSWDEAHPEADDTFCENICYFVTV